MRVSLKWLRDYVDVDVSATELGRRLTMAGIEVDAIHPVGSTWDHVWTARLVSIDRHPNADRLQLVLAEYGAGRSITVVTGATNIRVGDIVPLGLVGTNYRDGHSSPPVDRILAPSVMRGVPSEGMVMSGFELGISADHSGILVLSPDTTVGIPLAEALGDTVLELDLKGRPDGLSMLGIAREVAALMNGHVRFPVADATPARDRTISEPLAVTIADSERCPRFIAMVIKGVTLGPSPAWMQERLQAAGIRSINNVVDVTNFVMIEWGQPLHAFDYDCVPGGHLVARGARSGEVLQTLAAERSAVTLSEDMIVVAAHDDHGGRPLSLAGIIGGAVTEISPTTTNILLESANWHQARTRRTARALLPRPTDASRRFERGVPQEFALSAIERAAALIVDLAGGEIVGEPVDVWPAPRHRPPIELPLTECRRLIGIDYPSATVEDILARLGFHFTASGEGQEKSFLVEAPIWRLDIEQTADLVEEIARIDGYEKIPSTIMAGHLPNLLPSIEAVWEDTVRDALQSLGLAEVVPYTWTSAERLARVPNASDGIGALVDLRVHPHVDPVRIANPASNEQSVMRTSSISSLLETLQENVRRFDRDVHLFDVGRIFIPLNGDLPEERRIVTFALGGYRTGQSRAERIANTFFDAKAVVETLVEAMRLTGHGYVAVTHPAFHPYRAAALVLDYRAEAAGKKPIKPDDIVGIVGEIATDVAKAFGGSDRVFVASLDLDRMIAHATKTVVARPLPRYPSITEDLAFIVPAAIPADRLVASVAKTGAPLVEDVQVFDVYVGDQIPLGTRSIALTLTYRAPDRTLNGDEVTTVRTKIVGQAERQLGARLRGPALPARS